MHNKEIQSVIAALENTLWGEPWFGRSLYTLLDEVDPALAYKQPGKNAHSLAELLYHMVTWTVFTCRRLAKDTEKDAAYFEKNDWRIIDPAEHTWEKGIAAFKEANQQLIALLQTKEYTLLQEKVDYRSYDFKTLLWGIIEHHIYHIGQIAYVQKLLAV